MFDDLEARYAHASPLRRVLSLWAVSGALVHASIPALHAATTPVGPAGLWLWLLPLAALAVDLVIAPAARLRSAIAATSPTTTTRRRRPNAASPRTTISRRDRPRSTAKVSPVAPRVRRAG